MTLGRFQDERNREDIVGRKTLVTTGLELGYSHDLRSRRPGAVACLRRARRRPYDRHASWVMRRSVKRGAESCVLFFQLNVFTLLGLAWRLEHLGEPSQPFARHPG
jgi:hypothetical protein